MEPDAGRGTVTLDELLADARAHLERMSPEAAQSAAAGGALIVDIRSETQRSKDGVVPGAVFVQRNVLEWRCSPTSPARDPRLSDPSTRLILMCDEGYQSSLAAATLCSLGMREATDMIGGYRAWRDAGLPTAPAQDPA